MSPETRSTVYALDPRASRVTVEVLAGGPLGFLGHKPKFTVPELSGRIHLIPGVLTSARARFTVRADRLTLLNDVKQRDREEIETRMRGEVLETARFPEIELAIAELRATGSQGSAALVEVAGEFTLHGVTRAERFRARVLENGGALHAYGSFALRQTDYGIRLVSALGGGLVVKDEVSCSFDVVARREG